MNNRSRTSATVVNSSVSVIAQVVQLVAQFISRTFFIHILGAEYLGLNGLFVNLLGYLNFAELGIGSAIVFVLFQPLADHDENAINAIMKMFRKWYRLIAVVVLIAGLILSIFVPDLINNNSNHLDINIRVAFLIALMNTVLSYTVTYKRTLLIADQKVYINIINSVGFNVVGQILQIMFLILFHSFYTYLAIQAIVMLASNVEISRKVDKIYPFLKKPVIEGVPDKTKQYLKKNIGGMISSKIGGIIVNGTDNILLSYFVGLTVVGLYSNYTMILTGLTALFSQLISAVSSSIGNLSVVDSKGEKQVRVFYEYFIVSTFLTVFLVVGFTAFSPAFVTKWIGPKMMFVGSTLGIIAINFFLQTIRTSLINYTNAYGLYWYARWKPVVESIVNFVISFVLVSNTKLGIMAVLLGTICSNIFVNYLWEPWIITKYGLKAKFSQFIRVYIAVGVWGTGSILSIVFLLRFIPTNSIIWGLLFTVCAEFISLTGVVILFIVLLPDHNLVKEPGEKIFQIVKQVLSR